MREVFIHLTVITYITIVSVVSNITLLWTFAHKCNIKMEYLFVTLSTEKALARIATRCVAAHSLTKEGYFERKQGDLRLIFTY